MSNTDEQNKDNMAVDDVIKQISDFSEKLHAKNQKRIKNGIICIFVIPLIFLIVLFAADSSKVVYLLLWVISMFIIAAYLISVAYIDYTMQEKLEKLELLPVCQDSEADIPEYHFLFLSEIPFSLLHMPHALTYRTLCHHFSGIRPSVQISFLSDF